VPAREASPAREAGAGRVGGAAALWRGPVRGRPAGAGPEAPGDHRAGPRRPARRRELGVADAVGARARPGAAADPPRLASGAAHLAAALAAGPGEHPGGAERARPPDGVVEPPAVVALRATGVRRL